MDWSEESKFLQRRTWKDGVSGYFVSTCNLNFMGQPHLWLYTNKLFVMGVRGNLKASLNRVGSMFLSGKNEM